MPLTTDLYKSLYSKYSPNLSPEEIDSKVAYAETLDQGEFLNSFYTKYTGGPPTAEQYSYISEVLGNGKDPMKTPVAKSGKNVTGSQLNGGSSESLSALNKRNTTLGSINNKESTVNKFEGIQDYAKDSKYDDIKTWKEDIVAVANSYSGPTYDKYKEMEKLLYRAPSMLNFDGSAKKKVIDVVKEKMLGKPSSNLEDISNNASSVVVDLINNDDVIQAYSKSILSKNKPKIENKKLELQEKYDTNSPKGLASAEKEFQQFITESFDIPLYKSDIVKNRIFEIEKVVGEAKDALSTSYERTDDKFFRAIDVAKSAGGITEVLASMIEGIASGSKGIASSVRTATTSFKGAYNEDLNNELKFLKSKDGDKEFASKWKLYSGKYASLPRFDSREEAIKWIENSEDRSSKEIDKSIEQIKNNQKALSLYTKINFDDDDGISINDIAGSIGQALPQMGMAMAGSATGIPLLGGIGIASMFMQQYGENYWTAVETGLKNELGTTPTSEQLSDAVKSGKYDDKAIAALTAIAQTALEKWGADQLVGATFKSLGASTTEKGIGSLFKGELKEFVNRSISTGIGATKSGMIEYLTEGAQGLLGQMSTGVQLGSVKETFKYFDIKDLKTQATSGALVGVFLPYAGALKRQAFTETRNIARDFVTKFDIKTVGKSLKQADIFFRTAEDKINNSNASEEDKAQELEAVRNIRNAGLKIPSHLKGESRARVFDLLLEKQKLTNTVDTNDKALVVNEIEAIKKIDMKLGSIIATSRITSNVLKAAGKGELGSNIRVANTTEEAIALSKETGVDLNGNEGAISADGKTIVIDLEKAADVYSFNVAGHELLHRVLYKTLFKEVPILDADGKPTGKFNIEGTETARSLAIELKKHIDNIDLNLIKDSTFKKRLELYKDKGKTIQAEETLTLFADALASGDIKLNENVLTKIGDVIRRALQTVGWKNISFKDGKDVVNFLKDYNKSIEKGKSLEGFRGKGAIGKMARDGAEIVRGKDGIKNLKDDTDSFAYDSKKSISIEQEMSNLEERLNNGSLDYDDYEVAMSKIEDKLENLDKEPTPEKKYVKPVKTPPSIEKRPAKGNLQALFDENEGDAKKMVSKILTTTPGGQETFELQKSKFGQEIGGLVETITRRLYDGIPEDAKKTVSRSDYKDALISNAAVLISKEYDPKKQKLDAFISSRLNLRANSLAKELGIESGEDSGGKGIGLDLDSAKGIIADDKTTNTADKPKFRNLLETKIVSTEVIKSIVDKVLLTIKTLKSRIDAPVTLNKTVTPIISEIRDAMGKQADIDLKTAMGGKKDGELRKWLTGSKKTILENMTTTWLMGKDMGTRVDGGMPIAIQKKVNGEWLSYPDWVGKKIDREAVSTDNAGRTSGAELVRRLPNVNNSISNEDFLATVIGPDGNPIRGRKESLAKAIAEEISFDIINEDLSNEGPIWQALNNNQERLGVEIKSNIAADLSRQIERGNIKFSISVKDQDLLDKRIPLLVSNINFKTEISVGNVKSAVIATFPEWLEPAINEVSSKLAIHLRKGVQGLGRYERLRKVEYAAIDIIERFKYSKDDGVAIRYKVGGTMPVSTMFRSKAYIEDLQALNINFGVSIINSYGQEEGLDLLKSLWLPTVADGKTIGEGRAVIFSGVEGFNEYLVNIQIVAGLENIIDPSLIKPTLRKENKVFANQLDGSNIATRDKEITEKAFKLSVDAVKFFSEAIESSNGKLNRNHLAAILTIMTSPRNSSLRSAANVGNVYLDKRTMDPSKYDYDHNPPARYIMARLIDKFVNKDTDVDLSLLEKDYTVNILPKRVSKNKINKAGLKQYMPIDYIEGKNPLSRISWALADPSIEYSKAVIKQSLSYSKPPKGISVLDFDDTLATTKSNVLYTLSDGTKGKLNAEEFAKRADELSAAGAIFDFSEFTKVTKGAKGPMFERAQELANKFGNENVFVLTARPADSKFAIHEFLQAQGLDIKLENIIGLGDGAAQAKADWMVGKVAEGYNDFYFSDDAIKNVKAVKDVLTQFDVKSDVVQAKIKFSLNMSDNFNKILEESAGIESYKKYSDIVAKRRGAAKGKYRFFIPPSAEDFTGLLYDFLGRGKQGEDHMDFFNQALIEPYTKGVSLIDAAKRKAKNDFRAVMDAHKTVAKKLGSLTPDGDFTYDQAIRVFMWTQGGQEIPGISKRDAKKLNDLVESDPELLDFSKSLVIVGKQDNVWVKPGEYWDTETIISDLNNITEKGGRKKFLEEFITNADEIFSKENLNKIEANFGTNFRSALEDSLFRMKNGKNRSASMSANEIRWNDWVNNSTGAIMFFNTRSAILQVISSINFLNWSDNNPAKAAMAFANQPQYWKDFSAIFNSDKLKERRAGLKSDVSAAEIANAAEGAKNKAKAVLSYLLKIGFTPTQMADSFAIASGGATFYRNRINTYIKQGLEKKDAEEKAWDDFSKISDSTQQSGDPMLISQQQASSIGRLILAFANTPMQYNRLIKKAARDLQNKRGDVKTNISKIIYYGALQNLIFSALQTALFALAFDDDEDEEKKKKLDKKGAKILNGMLDTILRGSGMTGAVVATLKNTAMKYMDQEAKGFKADYAQVLIEAANISPPIGSKFRKLYSGIKTYQFEKDVIKERGFGVIQDSKLNISPAWDVIGKVTEATTNLPMDRLISKVNNVAEGLDSRNASWQRIALLLGWKPWDVEVKNEENDLIKAGAKAGRKKAGIEKGKATRAANTQAKKDSIANLTGKAKEDYEQMLLDKKEATKLKRKLKSEKKKDSIKSLTGFGKLNYEKIQSDKKKLAKIKREIAAHEKNKNK